MICDFILDVDFPLVRMFFCGCEILKHYYVKHYYVMTLHAHIENSCAVFSFIPRAIMNSKSFSLFTNNKVLCRYMAIGLPKSMSVRCLGEIKNARYVTLQVTSNSWWVGMSSTQC